MAKPNKSAGKSGGGAMAGGQNAAAAAVVDAYDDDFIEEEDFEVDHDISVQNVIDDNIVNAKQESPDDNGTYDVKGKNAAERFENFSKMSTDQQLELIDKAIGDSSIKDNDSFENVLKATGIDGKPRVVDDNEFNSISGDVLYSNISGYGSVEKESNAFLNGGFNEFYNNSQAGAHMNGMYFVDDKSSAYEYGLSSSFKQARISAKLNGKAKSISNDDLYESLVNECNNNTKIGKWFKNNKGYNGTAGLDGNSLSIYALMKGYNVIKRDDITGDGATVVLSRSVLTVSKNIQKLSFKSY